MGIMKLLGLEAKNKMQDAQRNLIGLISKWDFNTVEEYELSEREKMLNQVTAQMVSAKSAFAREQGEYDSILASYNQKVADAEKIHQATLSSTISIEKKHKFEEHLEKLLDEIENMKPDIEREEEEAKEAKDDFEMLKEVVETAAKKLVGAKNELAKKRRELNRLETQETQAKERENRQLELSGIRKQIDSMDTITSALDAQIESRKGRIAMSIEKTNALQKASGSGLTASETNDPDILDVIREDVSKKPKGSFADRISELKKNK